MRFDYRTYPFDIVYVKMSVQRQLLNPIRETPLKTSNYFPTISLKILEKGRGGGGGGGNKQ